MKVGVLGSGLMGKEAARDLVESEAVEKVGLADINLKQAERACEQLKSTKLKAYQVNASNEKELAQYMRQFDVIINALFYTFNEVVAKTAIHIGVHSIDLGGHIGNVTNHILTLNRKAERAGVTIIPDLGVAPGMINILAGHGTKKLDKVNTIKLYVGGIPTRPDPPLEYNHVFSMEGLLDHYTDSALIIRNSTKQEVPALSEVEKVYFDQFGPLEAFHTSGGTSTLSHSYPELKTLEYKTIRYPGHAEKMQLLVDLNLTSVDYYVEVKGQKINPRAVLLKVLNPILDLGEKDDVVLLRVIVSGTKNGMPLSFEYEMMTYKDRKQQVTAMARATANTVSTVAQLIGSGVISKRGVYPPEQIVPGDEYIAEMKKRGVIIRETEK